MPPADPESSSSSSANVPAPIRPRADPPAPAANNNAAPGMADLLLLARALLREGGGEAAPGSGTTSPAAGQLVTPGQARGPLPKEQKKFYKLANPPAPAPAPTPTPAPAPLAPAGGPPLALTPAAGLERAANDGGADEPPVSPAPEPSASPATTGGRSVRPERGESTSVEQRTGGRRRSLSRRQRVLIIALGVSSAAGSFFVGLFLGWLARPPVAKTPADTGGANGGVDGAAAVSATAAAVASSSSALAARALNPDEGLRRALASVDEAAAAQRTGDWNRVDALLEQASREAGPRGVPGLLFRRAEVAVRRGDLNTANALAQRALETGQDVSKAYALRAVVAQRSNRPDAALPMLEAASRADPFESRYLFYQAQSLRTQGKLQEAASRIRRALDRVEDPVLAENYRHTLRLTQVELGESHVFAEELARRLAEPNPAPDWLVAAGARECQAGRLKEGAEFLRRAFAAGGPGYAAGRLGDVFFRALADRPEMSPLYAQYLPTPTPVAAPSPAATATPMSSLLVPSSGQLLPPGPTTLPPAPVPPAAVPGPPTP